MLYDTHCNTKLFETEFQARADNHPFSHSTGNVHPFNFQLGKISMAYETFPRLHKIEELGGKFFDTKGFLEVVCTLIIILDFVSCKLELDSNITRYI